MVKSYQKSDKFFIAQYYNLKKPFCVIISEWGIKRQKPLLIKPSLAFFINKKSFFSIRGAKRKLIWIQSSIFQCQSFEDLIRIVIIGVAGIGKQSLVLQVRKDDEHGERETRIDRSIHPTQWEVKWSHTFKCQIFLSN